MTTTPFDHLLSEHRALLAHYGRSQLRCTELLTWQEQEIERLQAQAMRLRARAIVRDSQWAFAQEDHAALVASLPGLPRRRALAAQAEHLAQRMQALAREVLHWQWRAGRGAGPAGGGPASDGGVGARAEGRHPQPSATLPRSVLWIARSDVGGWVTRQSGPGAGSPVPQEAAARHTPGAFNALALECADPQALEASLVAADLVICQTGCLGHNDYWRVQDHCKRTGKACVMVDRPQVVHWTRELQSADTPDAARASNHAQSDHLL
ncbi:DUF2325 domain-containing protein [Acidovorax sp. Leaf160]|uniref:DUF2325 domain-containing protein n=1 Tax=Acidovorax sp. Leaf160 TaxID=1736280 RepID=UPI0006FC7A6D|nr:DUF2325 domain-containing protein [Acidovorax sp. Leaf160]KQR45738.1 hypothetical protein ASF94_08120 [Acidovorax sp. Leaf160]